jgi:transcriptional regulator with XRE-family HTH domain
MVRDQQKYDEAVRLRQRGFTLEEIAKYCGVSKSTVSKWLKNNAFSAAVTKQNKQRVGQENAKRLRLIAKARGGERQTRYKEAVKAAETAYKHYRSAPLFVAGMMLYQAHADQVDRHKVRFSSADANAHQIFIRFVHEYGGIERTKIHIWLQLYDATSEERAMKHWKRMTGLPYAQFYKNQVIRRTGAHRPLHNGVGNTIIGSTVLQAQLQRWLQLLQKDLVKQS